MPYTIRVCPHPSTKRSTYDVHTDDYRDFLTIKRFASDFTSSTWNSVLIRFNEDGLTDFFMVPSDLLTFRATLTNEEAREYMRLAHWLSWNDPNGTYLPFAQWEQFEEIIPLSTLKEVYERQSSDD
jgi:hypothetical protein